MPLFTRKAEQAGNRLAHSLFIGKLMNYTSNLLYKNIALTN
jgi:hypothetical protein